MNTEEVYRSLRRTTAEIQNYSFETKLDRDTNSKDSGISQMGDHMLQIEQFTTANGYNGHIGYVLIIIMIFFMKDELFDIVYISLDKEDSCNGSKTQSTATTESNTPENTIRLDSINSNNKTVTQKRRPNVTFDENGELITEKGIKEGEILQLTLNINADNAIINPDRTCHLLSQLSICITYGNCQLPIRNFKYDFKLYDINKQFLKMLFLLSK